MGRDINMVEKRCTRVSYLSMTRVTAIFTTGSMHVQDIHCVTIYLIICTKFNLRKTIILCLVLVHFKNIETVF